MSGIEPEAFRMRNGRSTTELHPRLANSTDFESKLTIILINLITFIKRFCFKILNRIISFSKKVSFKFLFYKKLN